MTITLEAAEIPRRKSNYGGDAGPLVIPPGAQHFPGKKKCETCGRMVASDRVKVRKGTCKCLYYKRTTTFIDVIQDEYLLKKWGNRNVAYGMSQRPDLVLHASSCAPDEYGEFTDYDKRELNTIADEAQREAGDKIKATIGTSLHRLTHRMDRGETLGKVPDRWQADLRVYDETIKALGIEWVSVESFRVLDKWVKDISQCDHKPVRYGGNCTCFGVGGTVDRIGWYRGRLCIFDIKTGSQFNKLGHAMQLAAYGHMVPYEYPGDTRVSDPGQVDLSVGYIIYLPEGQGTCTVEPFDLEMGWAACEHARETWRFRSLDPVITIDPIGEFCDIASRTTTLLGLRQLWKVAKTDGYLTATVQNAIMSRVKELKAQGVTA